jgi:hypothetical protein
MQEALYFRRMIGSVTSVNQLMADATLTKVAVGGAGLPQQFGLLDYSQQVPILTKAIDLTKFKSPAYVDQFVEQYLIQNQASQSGSASATGILSLFSGSGASQGTDLLSTLFAGSSSSSGSSSSLLGALFSTTA